MHWYWVCGILNPRKATVLVQEDGDVHECTESVQSQASPDTQTLAMPLGAGRFYGTCVCINNREMSHIVPPVH